MQGRKPKPAEQKEIEGNPGKRKVVPPAVVGSAIDVTLGQSLAAPDYLPVEVVEVWDEIVPALVEVGLARTVDVPALEALCTHVAIARHAFDALTSQADGVRRLDLDKFVDYTDKGVPVVSPYHRIYRDSWRDALKLAEHYGLTPISRTRLGIAALQQKGLAAQLQEIMGDGSVVEGEVIDEGYLAVAVCLGCGVEKGRRHGPTCARPGFSSKHALDPGEVIARAE